MAAELPPEIQTLIGQHVVVDTDSSLVYIGVLNAAGSDYLTLSNVDVQEMTDTGSTKEQYAHEARKLGLRPNRKQTLLRLARVVSISKLDDVIKF